MPTETEKAAAVIDALRGLMPGDTVQVIGEWAPFQGAIGIVNSLHGYAHDVFIDVEMTINGVTQAMGYYIEELQLV